jgi:hypothetical protein
MATPRIETEAFVGWRGRLHAAVRRTAPLPPRTRVNGEAWVMDSWSTKPEVIVTSRDFATQLEAAGALEVYRALMDGATKTAVDPLARSWSVKVRHVTGEISQTVRGTFRLVAIWKLQVEAAP